MPNAAVRFALAVAGPSGTDAELLARFAAGRDEAAFAEVVRRHRGLVRGTARRLVGDPAAADDVAQAAFLVLASKAGAGDWGPTVGPWLYAVAARLGRKARARRRFVPVPADAAGPAADPAAGLLWAEVRSALDAALARLPASLRDPLVLCYLQGLTRDEAAAALGDSPAAVKGRLARGRARLRAELERRGVTLPAALAGVLVADAGGTPAAATARLAAEYMMTGSAPGPVLALLRGATAAAGWKAGVVAVGVLAACVGGAVGLSGAGPDAPPKPQAAATPPPADRYGDPLPAGAVLRIGTTRLRHPGVFSMAFTSDNKLASVGTDAVVRVWEPTTGRLLRERAFDLDLAHTSWEGCLSPDARRLAAPKWEGDRNWVKVFDVASSRELAAVGYAKHASAVFSPDGGRLAVLDLDPQKETWKLLICDIPTNATHELATLSFASRPVFSRDGRRLAAADNNGLHVWDVASGRELLRYSPPEKVSLRMADFDATGDVVAVYGYKDPPQVYFIRVSTGRPAEGWIAPEIDNATYFRFAPDGSTLVLTAQWKSTLWFDPKTGRTTRATAESKGNRGSIPPAFSADGRLVATARDHMIDLWDATTAEPAGPGGLGDLPQGEVDGVAVSPDGRWIVTKDADTGLVRIWGRDGRPGGAVRSARSFPRYPVFSPDGRHLYGAAPGGDALVRWDFPSGAESLRYVPAGKESISTFGLSADGRRLAGLSSIIKPRPGWPEVVGFVVTVWDAATGERLESRPVMTKVDWLGYGAFSPDLRWFYQSNQAVPLGADPAAPLDLPPKADGTRAVSPDGRLVAHGTLLGRDAGVLVVFEAATGKRVWTAPPGACGVPAFTPDGRGLVVAARDALTRWDLATQKSVARHPAPHRVRGSYGESFASSLAVFPDGTRAVTGHIDTTALVWDISAPARRIKAISDKELAAAWDDLAGADAGKGFAAVWALADGGPGAVAFLRAKLRPVAEAPRDEMQKLVAKLDAPGFADREAATRALRLLGDAAVPALRAAADLSPEQRARVEPILAAAGAWPLPPGDRLRETRAVAALELHRTEVARNLLAEMAGGLPDARLTREARKALIP